tara:strand:- start:1319 stop:2794 length:1476 start_codon:yes stop_codon:yes gene_type:complete
MFGIESFSALPFSSLGGEFKDGASTLSATATISARPSFIRASDISLASQATITAGGSLLTTNSSNLKGQGSLTANNSLILSIGSDFESQATLEAITSVDGAGKAFLSTSSQIVANNSMILNGGYSPGSFSEGFNGAFDIVNIPLLIAGQGVVDSFLSNVTKASSPVELKSSATLTATASLSFEVSANLKGQGTLESEGGSWRFGNSQLSTKSRLSATPSLIINGAYSTGSFSQAFNNSFDIVNKHIFFGGEGSVIGELSEGGGELLGSASLEASSTLTGRGSISLTSQGIDGSLSSQGTLVSNLTNSVEFSEGVSLLSSSSTLSAAGSLLSLSSSSISGSATLTGNIETQTFSAGLASSSTITGNGVLVGRTEVVNFPLYIHRLQQVTLQSLSSLTSIGGESASLVLFDSNISRQQTFSLSKLSTGLYSLLEQKSLCEFDLNLVTAQSFSLNVHSINNIDSYLEYDSIFNMNLDQSTEFMTEIDTAFEVAL